MKQIGQCKMEKGEKGKMGMIDNERQLILFTNIISLFPFSHFPFLTLNFSRQK